MAIAMLNVDKSVHPDLSESAIIGACLLVPNAKTGFSLIELTEAELQKISSMARAMTSVNNTHTNIEFAEGLIINHLTKKYPRLILASENEKMMHTEDRKTIFRHTFYFNVTTLPKAQLEA